MNLTAQKAGALRLTAGQTDRIVFDDAIPGFGLRLRSGGSRNWIFQYKFGGVSYRMPLGKASAIAAGEAREMAAKLYARVKLGENPAAQKKVAKASAADTFDKLVQKYLEFQETNIRPRSYKEVKRHLEKHAKSLRRLSIVSIDQRMISDRLTAIAKASGAVTANRVRSSLSAMFGWAMGEGLIGANPVMNTNKREEKSRDRILTASELRTIWRALQNDQYGAIIKILMLTGQRRNEIAGLLWSEIDFDRNLISLPAARVKNGRPHEVPITSTVRALFKSQTKSAGRDLVFGYGDGPFSGLARAKKALDARITKAVGEPLPHWTPHDLRRTAATGMADLGVQPHVIESVLNHVGGYKGGIAGIYNRSLYTAEKVQALALWDDHIVALVEGRTGNVTPLRREA